MGEAIDREKVVEVVERHASRWQEREQQNPPAHKFDLTAEQASKLAAMDILAAINALPSLPPSPAQGEGERTDPALVDLYATASLLVRDMDRKHDTHEPPLKYTAPWGAIAGLREAVRRAEAAVPCLPALSSLRALIPTKPEGRE